MEVVEVEEEKSAEDAVVVSFSDEVCNAVESDDESDGLENKP